MATFEEHFLTSELFEHGAFFIQYRLRNALGQFMASIVDFIHFGFEFWLRFFSRSHHGPHLIGEKRQVDVWKVRKMMQKSDCVTLTKVRFTFRPNSLGPLTDDWKVMDDLSVYFHDVFFFIFCQIIAKDEEKHVMEIYG